MMEDSLKVTINEYLPLRDVVFNTLRQAILKGELKPGERLMEIQLAKRLGVSRTPIREAIRKLELEGLVVMIPRKGAEVAKITEKDLRDVLEVRCTLEELAVSLAACNIKKEDVAILEEKNNAFIESIGRDNVVEMAEADVNFHDAIYALTDNARLIQILNNLREQMYRYRFEYIKDSDKRKTLVEEHKIIIEALANKDIEAVKKAVRQHIENQEKNVIKAINTTK